MKYTYYSLTVMTIEFALFVEGSRCKVRKFPPGFLFGTATAAYQIEGAWNVDGNSPFIVYLRKINLLASLICFH